ncbi:DUF3102 domain-containing protein [Levilactobacillus enshiensis]|uniref:DUF3102 domain-containing protein n=1 Tax=Levilactobacillus enshiensis TaxID=2590213 RepID=UPI00117AB30E|nr:DUF3102 domain-containing protein [Levilactobacillus enshiensis]
MQEIALSDNLTQLTTEIKSYQSIGGQAIFEIGRRLKWVKEHDLAHGEFGKWLESIKINDRMARQFIKIAAELDERRTSSDLGMQALYEIATMPESERDKPQHLPSGEVKKPDEMTVRELRETKKQLKNSNEELEKLRNQPPRVIEKELHVETVPEDYDMLKGMVDNQKATLDRYIKDDAELRKELDGAQEQIKNLTQKEPVSFNNLLVEFIGRALPMADTENVRKQITNPKESESVFMNISTIRKWCEEMEESSAGSTIIEGEFHDTVS